jgi:GNAT superfamily N-acetyltransferase
MYEDLGARTLKSKEHAVAARITAPDPDWAQQLVDLLRHKGDPWNWQNAELLMRDCGVDAYFHILHRNGSPFSNIMTVLYRGAGIFGHVFTDEDDRRKGAAGMLMDNVMEHFRAASGSALFLGTGYGGEAYRMYEKHGFASIEPGSGYMAFYADSKEAFDAAYFAPGSTAIEPLTWRHWPASCALFMGEWPGLARCVPLRLYGRMSTEGPMLSQIRTEQKRRKAGEPPRVYALEHTVSGAVCGLAAWDWHPLWPNTCLVDVYCHPNHVAKAKDLYSRLDLPEAECYVAYADEACSHKVALLAAAGFELTAELPQRIPKDRAKTGYVNVQVFEKR